MKNCPKNFLGMEIKEFAALMVRLSMTSQSPGQVARALRRSSSLVNKWTEGDEAQVPNLEQFLETIAFTRDFEGVKRLAEACGFVVVRRNGSPAQVLRDLAEDLERQGAGGSQARPAAQYRFPGEKEA
jgi:hypothetical protein